MPPGYLALLGFIAIATAVSLTRPRRFGRAAYFFAVAVNEIPVAFAVYLAGATASSWAIGDLGGSSGAVVTLVAALVVVGLVEVMRRSWSAPMLVASALEAAGIEAPSLRPWHRLRAALAPLPLRPRTVRRVRNRAYGPHRHQRLDVYHRKDAVRPGPVLLYLHGGGYFTGSKHWESRALLHRLAARGWTCVSASYRLRPAADFPDHLADARAALAWAHDHAGDFGGDPGTVVMVGSSAGAHLTALCALTQHEQEDRRSRVDTAICLYGYYGRYYGRDEDEEPVSSPLQLDAAVAPPFLLVHGTHDTRVPVELARAFANHLREHSRREVVHVELPSAQHGFDLFTSGRFVAVVEGIDAFLAATLRPVITPRNNRKESS